MPNPKSIGIKLYNDSFVPVLTENEDEIKKITLTTVRDDQKMAIIELYEGTSDKCINNEYLGKITIDIERATKKGEPAFEAHLRQDSNGMLYAKAWDIETGAESEIKIEHSQDTQRIFTETLSDEDTHTHSLDADENIATFSDDYVEEFEQRERKFPIFRIIILAIILLALLAGVVGLIVLGVRFVSNMNKQTEETRIEKQIEEDAKAEAEKKRQDEDAKAEAEKKRREELAKAQADKEAEEKADAEKKRQEEEAKAEAEKKRQEELAKAEAEAKRKKEEEQKKISGVRRGDGQPHFVRWGDNLWDICKKYYGDPWYYPALAEYNGLTNPRKIYAGSKIIIPDKSELRRWDFSR